VGTVIAACIVLGIEPDAESRGFGGFHGGGFGGGFGGFHGGGSTSLQMDLPHSDACFVKAYPAETSEAFCDGHNGAFAFFDKVPRSILYDNLWTPPAQGEAVGFWRCRMHESVRDGANRA
jgi:hypothetical protein